MRYISTGFGFLLSLMFTLPAWAAGSKKFEHTLSAPLNQPVKIEVNLGEDLVYRADHLPKDRRDRGSAYGVGSLNNGFVNNGYYGQRDLDRLKTKLQTRIEKRFEKAGIPVSENAETVLRLNIIDARPNRPTHTQLAKSANLSYNSFGIGGASFEGELVSASGNSLGTLSYAWYETHIDNAAFGGTWSDARRAIDRFSRKTAKLIKPSE